MSGRREEKPGLGCGTQTVSLGLPVPTAGPLHGLEAGHFVFPPKPRRRNHALLTRGERFRVENAGAERSSLERVQPAFWCLLVLSPGQGRTLSLRPERLMTSSNRRPSTHFQGDLVGQNRDAALTACTERACMTLGQMCRVSRCGATPTGLKAEGLPPVREIPLHGRRKGLRVSLCPSPWLGSATYCPVTSRIAPHGVSRVLTRWPLESMDITSVLSSGVLSLAYWSVQRTA